MKKFRHFLGCCAVLWMAGSSGLNAQTHIAVRAGLNLSALNTEIDSVRNGAARLGYHIGGEFRIGRKWYFLPGVYWHSNALEMVKKVNSSQELKDLLVTRHLRVPVQVGYCLAGDNNADFNLRLSAGINSSFLLNVSSNPFGFEKKDFTATTWGWQAGLGFDLWFLTLDLGYSGDFSPYFSGINGKNNVVMIAAGIVF